MSRYTAAVRVDDGTLFTARPLTAPDSVRDVVEAVVDHVVTRGEEGLSVELTFDTAENSDTPVGDSITSTTATPLDPFDGDAVDDAPGPLVPATAGQSA